MNGLEPEQLALATQVACQMVSRGMCRAKAIVAAQNMVREAATPKPAPVETPLQRAMKNYHPTPWKENG